MNVLASYKTTITGVLLIIVAGLKIAGFDIPGFSGDAGALIMGGIGLILAKDANVTGVK